MKILRLMLGFLLMAMLSSPIIVSAKDTQKQNIDKVIKAVDAKKNEELDKESKSIVKEALNGVVLTQKAYKLLDQNKIDDAKGVMIKALSEIDTAISSSNGEDLLPIKVDVQVLAGVYNLNTAIARRDAALEVLQDGDVQSVRALLSPMVDEIDVEVVSLPIETYKQKLNDAIGLLGNDKKWESREKLREALSLAVIKVEVIPIPLIEAESLVNEAMDIEKTDKQQALDLLQKATKAITLSDVLGYTTKSEKDIWDRIHAENKSLGKFKHQKLIKNILKKINILEEKIKDGTTEMHNKISSELKKIRNKLSAK